LAGRAAAAPLTKISNSADLSTVEKDFMAFSTAVPHDMAQRMKNWITFGGGALKDADYMTTNNEFAGKIYTAEEQTLWDGMANKINAFHTGHSDQEGRSVQYDQFSNWLVKFKVSDDATKPGLNGNLSQGASIDPAAGNANMQLSNTPPKGKIHTASRPADIAQAGSAASALEHFTYNWAKRFNSGVRLSPEEVKDYNTFLESATLADPKVGPLLAQKIEDYQNAGAQNWDAPKQDELRRPTIHGFAQTIMANGTQGKFDKLPSVVDAPPVPAAPTAPTMPPAGTVPHLPHGGARQMQI